MSPKQIIVEIAAHSVQSVLAAQAGGAHRVELFSDPLEGGVTPSEGLVAVVRDRLKIPLHVIIRPRGGDFCYSDEEQDVMHRDIAAVKRIGADGVVLGVLNPEGSISVELTRELVEAARPMSVTFHRAFDMCKDLSAALKDIIACGSDRVLTSGGAAFASEGLPLLHSLAREAGEQISLIAAGGVRPANLRAIVQQTGVREVHASLRIAVQSPMLFRNETVSFGKAHNEFERIIVREQDVRSLVEQAEGL
ncbi:MAG TPA: copper homeostasis protein CutC [Terriglobales bacterium]|nr:copper homeostasis protein CutC [Terriglobales bacterium]